MIRNLIVLTAPAADGAASLPVFKPATGSHRAVPLSARSVDAVRRGGGQGLPGLVADSADGARASHVSLQTVLEEHFEELASIITRHHGKSWMSRRARWARHRGGRLRVRRAHASQGRTLRDVSGGVDQDLYRYPRRRLRGIPPFNFPVMTRCGCSLAVVAGTRCPQAVGAHAVGASGWPSSSWKRVSQGVSTSCTGHEAVDALLASEGRRDSFVVPHRWKTRLRDSGRTRSGSRPRRRRTTSCMPTPTPSWPAGDPQSGWQNAGERCSRFGCRASPSRGHPARPARDRRAKMVVGPGDQPGVQSDPSSAPSIADRSRLHHKGVAEVRSSCRRRREMSRPDSFSADHPRPRDRRNDGRPRGDLCPVLSSPAATSTGDRPGQPDGARQHGDDLHHSGDPPRFRTGRGGDDRINLPIAQPFRSFRSAAEGVVLWDLHVHGTDASISSRQEVVVRGGDVRARCTRLTQTTRRASGTTRRHRRAQVRDSKRSGRSHLQPGHRRGHLRRTCAMRPRIHELMRTAGATEDQIGWKLIEEMSMRPRKFSSRRLRSTRAQRPPLDPDRPRLFRDAAPSSNRPWVQRPRPEHDRQDPGHQSGHRCDRRATHRGISINATVCLHAAAVHRRR